MTRRSIAVAAALLVLSAVPLHAGDAAWPHWRGPDRNGISAEKDFKADWSGGLQTLWKASVGTGFSSFSVVDGRVYTMGNRDNTDTVYAFDAATGKEVWKHSYPCDLAPKYYDGGTSATPTVEDGKVYTLSKFGHVFCLDAATGKVLWKCNVTEDPGAKPPTWGFAGSACIEGPRLYLNVGAAGICLEKATGKILWRSGNTPAGYSTPVPCGIGGQKTIALFVQRTVVGVNPENGKLRWEHKWRTSHDANIADPIVSGNEVFISSGYGAGCALIRIAGGSATEVWRNKNMRNHINSCVLWEGHLYGVDDNAGKKNTVKCLDWKTGEVKWEQGGLGCGSLMIAGGRLLILGEKGTLVLAEALPAAWKEITRAQILKGKCWTVPVLCGGRLYARNSKGDVVCVAMK
jgi:outer membrane protein assembly factor BamB